MWWRKIKDIQCWVCVKVDGNLNLFFDRGVSDGFVRGVGDEVDTSVGDEFDEGVEL